MIRNELNRVLNRSYALFVLALLVVNVLLLSSISPLNDVTPEQIKESFQKIASENLTMKEIEHHYQGLLLGDDEESLFSDQMWEDLFITSFVRDYLGAIEAYPSYIESVSEESLDIPIFDRSDERQRTVKEISRQNYSKLKGLSLEPVMFLSVEEPIRFVPTDLLLLVLLFYTTMIVFWEDRENGTLDFYRSMKRGRIPLATAKLLTIAILAMIFVLLFYGCNLLVGVVKYGAVDYSLPIQSIRFMMSSFLQLNIGQYLRLFLGLKVWAFVFAASLLSLWALIARSGRSFFLGSFLFFIGSWILYTYLEGISMFGMLKVINIKALLQVHFFMTQLQVFWIGGLSLTSLQFLWFILMMGLISLVWIVIRVMERAEMTETGGNARFLPDIKFFHRVPRSLATFERYKITNYHKTAAIMLLFSLWVVWRTMQLMNPLWICKNNTTDGMSISFRTRHMGKRKNY